MPIQAESSLAHCLASHYAKGGDPTTDNYVVTGGSFDVAYGLDEEQNASEELMGCLKARERGGGFEGTVAHSLRAEGFDASEDGTGRGTPIVPVVAPCLTQNYGKQPDNSDTNAGPMLIPLTFAADDYKNMTFEETDVARPLTNLPDRTRAAPVVAFSAKDHGADAMEDCSPTLRAGGHAGSHANAGVMPAVAIPILEAGARTGISTTDPRAGIGIGEDGDPMFTLQSGKQHAVALPIHDKATRHAGHSQDRAEADGNGNGLGIGSDGDPMFTVTSGDHHAVAVGAFKPGQSAEARSLGYEADVCPSLESGGGGNNKPALHVGMAVRRLTPLECARLQAFPDDFLDIEVRGKPAADGPKYKALGNAVTVNVSRWIAERIKRYGFPHASGLWSPNGGS